MLHRNVIYSPLKPSLMQQDESTVNMKYSNILYYIRLVLFVFFISLEEMGMDK